MYLIRRWTNEEKKFVLDRYLTTPIIEICEHLGRSKLSIYHTANKLGLYRTHPHIPWTEEDIKFLRENYAVMSSEEMGGVLNRAPNQVRIKASKIGCSKYTHTGKITVTCNFCDEKFERFVSRVRSEKQFCSRGCRFMHQRGQNSHFYIDGRAKGRNDYRGVGWKMQRKRAIQRDIYTCQVCGEEGRSPDLEVHHLIPYFETQDNSLTNLITLCHYCHGKVHQGYVML